MRPIIDVGLLAFLLYKAYGLLVRTQAMQVIKGVLFLGLIYGLALVLKLSTISWILTTLAQGILIALAIVFQPELRKIIIRLGITEIFRPTNKPRTGQLEAVITAAETLSAQRRGMLIVFPRRTNIINTIGTGTRIGGEISSTLIVTVFQFDGPLHDGAMVIQNGKITAAGCFLPLSEQQNIRKSFGTRHRAALGMTEVSDAAVLIVSEETGAISLAYDAQIYYDLSTDEVLQKLRALMEKYTRGDKERLRAEPAEGAPAEEAPIDDEEGEQTPAYK